MLGIAARAAAGRCAWTVTLVAAVLWVGLHNPNVVALSGLGANAAEFQGLGLIEGITVRNETPHEDSLLPVNNFVEFVSARPDRAPDITFATGSNCRFGARPPRLREIKHGCIDRKHPDDGMNLLIVGRSLAVVFQTKIAPEGIISPRVIKAAPVNIDVSTQLSFSRLSREINGRLGSIGGFLSRIGRDFSVGEAFANDFQLNVEQRKLTASNDDKPCSKETGCIMREPAPKSFVILTVLLFFGSIISTLSLCWWKGLLR